MMASESDDLPWGSFPAERYLLQHWDHASNEDKKHQYQRLIRAFLASGMLVDEAGSEERGPQKGEIEQSEVSEELIKSVLRPWRSEQLRKVAGALKNHREDQVVILRTNYSGDAAADDIVRTIVEEDEDNDPFFEEDDCWWRILDDQSCFDFGDDFQRVYDLLPELTGRGRGLKSSVYPDTFEKAEMNQREGLRQPQEYIQYNASLASLPIALADKETFSTSTLQFIWVDANGNAIRSTRADASDLGYFRGTYFRGNSWNWNLWEDADVSAAYKPEGEIGKVLYARMTETNAS